MVPRNQNTDSELKAGKKSNTGLIITVVGIIAFIALMFFLFFTPDVKTAADGSPIIKMEDQTVTVPNVKTPDVDFTAPDVDVKRGSVTVTPESK